MDQITRTIIPLDQLPVGSKGRVVALRSDCHMRRRMQDLGLVDKTLVEAVHKSPAGDPTAYRIRGAVIALRQSDAHHVLIASV